jgi:hypothetical protein
MGVPTAVAVRLAVTGWVVSATAIFRLPQVKWVRPISYTPVASAGSRKSSLSDPFLLQLHLQFMIVLFFEVDYLGSLYMRRSHPALLSTP